MDLSEVTRRATDVAALYDRLNEQQRGRTWTTDDYMLGFVGDVGDLAKLVMAHSGTRDADDVREQLGHELADCLYSVAVLAHRTGVDLAAEFDRCMNLLTGYVGQQLDGPSAAAPAP
ncbi:nucleoside triphosphate pyrophosphohydrolase family protein [Luteipulveratus flavus]|uniref:Nucleotide pyrophosphohydrolase n=1 Tax=Luteipulveratus flavus TaxID=3031728 RepID=A0ABT6CAA8_9MICO|nr:nucleotide pyrophosphohydrolase [Luteipulveratus sp. YIM 133296]MDF8265257.1 nucleotide pyrophosphohydrolase [Luteipulveratus sp. YIM 133296]